ncbi:STAS domain-containing protein [Pleomorphomonas sp. JP5]|uniref:STAS domain-containing protein n=1 Tax=Pleomorphomonas sp. JP5 TaxID=2942998 RepID=UPI002042F13F|nr:STAS domain-containing protein [Pleomorphomonas sp. JP5]MCM5557971.1 STAS domain-containing protein [Pleomorphomonas sp. JP5]
MPSLERRKTSYDLPAVLDASAVRELHAQIEPLVSETADLTLNAAAVERLGTQAVQLLVATARALEMNGGRLAIVNITPTFREAYADLGLIAELDARSPLNAEKDSDG